MGQRSMVNGRQLVAGAYAMWLVSAIGCGAAALGEEQIQDDGEDKKNIGNIRHYKIYIICKKCITFN